MNYTELHKKFEEIRQWAMKHRTVVLTATQPSREGTGLSPDEINKLAKGPIFIDYIGNIHG